MGFHNTQCRFGIIGGLGTLGPADLFCKLARALPTAPGEGQAGVIFEQRPFHEGLHPGAATASQSGRKLYVFDLLRSYESRGAQAILLPCFLSHTFLAELQAEVQVPIVDMVAAVKDDILRRHPGARKIGILTSDYVRARRLFERYFDEADWQIIYPGEKTQVGCVMAAIYAAGGLKSGRASAHSVELLAQACSELVEQGADLIVPGFSEIPVVIDALRGRGFQMLDAHQAYVQSALSVDRVGREALKVGVVGGVGPAATVDFLGKVVRNTPARKDQDHIKMVIEQNPQIPDRTANLLRQEADPTIALYATCKRLESEGANVIAIPCNTAHAYVDRIQPYLSIPILNMLTETVRHIVDKYGKGATVGLLATSGTLESRVYHEAAAGQLELIVPDPEFQAMVMESIYGAQGAKAGHTQGPCADLLRAAIAHLMARDARIHILGCTELPLIFAQTETFQAGGGTVALVDPTDVLAKRCVQWAQAADNPESQSAPAPAGALAAS